jgi:hypothetical protein
VTEAASSTMWDVTAGAPGEGFHTWPVDTSPTGTAVALAQTQGQARYASFDGRVVATTRRTTATWAQVFTTAKNLKVECSVGAGLNYFPTLAMPQMRLAYAEVGGVQCSARADIANGGLGGKIGNFLDTGSGGKAYFKPQAYAAQGAAAGGTIRTCAMGRSSGGTCPKQLKMMVDDWGLSEGGGTGANACPVLIWGIPCPNMEYWMSTNLVYQATSIIWGTESLSDPGYNLVRTMYNRAPPPIWIPFISSPTSFYLSFVGEELLFQTITPWATDPVGWSWVWQTTPFVIWPTYAAAYAQSSGHYLGQPTGSTPAMP